MPKGFCRTALLAAVSALSCQVDAPESAGPAGDVLVRTADSAGIHVVEIRGPVEALREWHLEETPLAAIDGNSPPHIGSVGAAAITTDGGVLVYDRQRNELYAFNTVGGEPRLLAGPGDGPDELGALERLVVRPSGHIHAFDRRHNRISIFGPDGVFQEVLSVSPFFGSPGTSIRHAWLTRPDQVLRYGVVLQEETPAARGSRSVRDRIVQVGSPDGADPGASVRFAGEFVVRGQMGEIGSPFSNHPFVAVGDDRVVHGSGSTYDLTVSDLDLRPSIVIRWSDWQQVSAASVVESVRGPMNASLSDLRAVNPSAADQLLEDVLNDGALPEMLPALGSVLIDDAGRIWVSRFELTRDLRISTTEGYEPWNQVDVWHVLGPDGLPMARVTLPPDSRLLAVRAGRLLVVTRDELDVEHVRVLQIRTAPEAVR